MDHVSAIQKYIEVVRGSRELHVLIIEGPAGWGKTTTVEAALDRANIEAVHLGAYTTSLNLFNFLSENSDRVIIADDVAGLFNDQSSMAILKAATWPQRSNRRVVKWGSTSRKAMATEFEF
jgi:broad-specificity NMP kinase